jgi:hypothetical protein
MSDKKINFNKRISMVKRETFKSITGDGELGSIAGTKKQGYYSLKSIFLHSNPFLDKYDLDIDLEIGKDNVQYTWIDCADDSDKVRKGVIDFSVIVGLKKLQLMANDVQSDGGVKSYIRRYALNIILNLPSTDVIDTDPWIMTLEKADTKKLVNVLYKVCEKDYDKAVNELYELSSFTNKENKKVGCRDFNKLDDNTKWLNSTILKAKKKYPNYFK